jgi:hypothetical protein
MVIMKCPACGAESKLSFVGDSYEGPRRCWKCRGLFTIRIEGNEMKSCEPLSEEEFAKQQEIEALKKKLKNR